ncbi:MAG: sulfite reductase subunit alpha [Chthoniobacterales bacterium]|jgi:sulfite reductase (NADPH) flavoprotein alpha-component|nr:sulfite reductase subunit alpha [Chthoniobacterales bacterium]
MSTAVLAYSRKNPFPARLTKSAPLTRGGSGKETLHFEVSLAGSGLAYEAGDSLGVFPTNDPADVASVLAAAGLSGDEKVESAGTALREVLAHHVTLREPSRQMLAAILEKDPSTSFRLSELIDPEAKSVMDDWVDGREVVDILDMFPGAKFTAEELVKVLRKLQPRLYSIASSSKVHPEAVHLTVAVLRYELHGRSRQGVASTYLADRVDDRTFPVFIHSAKHFRPPEDPSAPLIMVGPGTGIAPFRAFLQEREATGAAGKTWLFFGDRKRATDFLYEEEIKTWQEKGVLQRLDTAFSRDQADKIYVQHRMLENSPELWKWLEEGASFYVCGDASRMAKDVDRALHRIVEQAGGKSEEEAAAYVEEMKKSKRYRKDVY